MVRYVKSLGLLGAAAGVWLATIIQAEALICIERGSGRVIHTLSIGNYSSLPKIKNSVNDAVAMGQLFKDKGFKVNDRTEPNARALSNWVGSISSPCSEYDVAVFYYAGHSVEIGGRLFIIPSDFESGDRLRLADSYNDVLREGLIPLDEVTAALAKNSKIIYVIFDGCRDNPIGRETLRGAPTGAMFADQPGVHLAVFSSQPRACPRDGLSEADTNGPFVQAFTRAVAGNVTDMDELMIKLRSDVAKATSGEQVIDWYRASGAGGSIFGTVKQAEDEAALSPASGK